MLEDFTWAPSGRLVALAVTSVGTLTGYEGIHVIDLATGRDRRIDKSVELVAGLAWSRDGSKLAYVAGDKRSGAKELQVISADGSSYAKRVKVNPGGVPSSPTWSPDGRRIAYAAWHERHSNVYIANLDHAGRFVGLPRSECRACLVAGRQQDRDSRVRRDQVVHAGRERLDAPHRSSFSPRLPAAELLPLDWSPWPANLVA